MALRRMLLPLLLAVVVLGAAIALVVVLVTRDEATTSSSGTVTVGGHDTGAGSSYLKAGNIELRYSRSADRAPLERLAERLAGPPSDALAKAGQEVRVVHDAGVGGISARAWHRSLAVAAPDDPRLQEFVNAWLGRGATG